jgi:transposase
LLPPPLLRLPPGGTNQFPGGTCTHCGLNAFARRTRTIPLVMPPTVSDLVLRRSASNGINTRMRYTRDLTDEQWQTLDPLIPKPRKRRDGRGRPWKSRRSVLNGILWVLRTGAPWADLPDRYPSFQTCHRRFQQWVRFGVMTRIMTALAHELRIRGAIDVSEAFIDASFAPAKKGGARSEKRNAAREQRSWRLQIVMGCQFLFAQRVPLPTK